MGREKNRKESKGETKKSKKTQARCRAVSTPSCAKEPPILTLLSRPSLSLSKRRKMAVAAASTGTAEAAKGLIEAEAIEMGTWVLGGGQLFDSERAVSKSASEMRDPAGVGGSPGEGP